MHVRPLAEVPPGPLWLKVNADIVDAQENKMHVEAAYKFDGKDYPIKGLPMADTISAKRIDARSTESVLKKDGKVIHSAKGVIFAL